MSTDRTVSFEFSPPKNEVVEQKLIREVVPKLTVFNPEFVSVTYSAGGSTRDGTFSTIRKLQSLKLDSVPHLSVKSDNDEEIINSYRKLGETTILALRGDTSSEYRASEIISAFYSVRLIREKFGDDLRVLLAAYPEIHPESKTLDIDIAFFKEQVEAGADSAIKQFF